MFLAKTKGKSYLKDCIGPTDFWQSYWWLLNVRTNPHELMDTSDRSVSGLENMFGHIVTIGNLDY